MKVVELEWGFMTSTVKRPVLSNGTLVAAVYFSKGEGQVSGRFPTIYGIVTDDMSVSYETGKSSEIGGLPWHKLAEVYTIGSRDAERARKLAEKMATNMSPLRRGTVYIDKYDVRFAPKLEEGQKLVLKEKGKPPQKVVVVRSNCNDPDCCAGCPFKGNLGCTAPTSPFVGSSVCGRGPDAESFLRLRKEMDIQYVAAVVEDPQALKAGMEPSMPNVFCDFAVLKDDRVLELPEFIGRKVIFSVERRMSDSDGVALVGRVNDKQVEEYVRDIFKRTLFIPVCASEWCGRWFKPGLVDYGESKEWRLDVPCRIGALVEFADGRLEWVFKK